MSESEIISGFRSFLKLKMEAEKRRALDSFIKEVCLYLDGVKLVLGEEDKLYQWLCSLFDEFSTFDEFMED